MTNAADAIAIDILTNNYFQTLYKNCALQSALYALGEKSCLIKTRKQYEDLLRFADLLSCASCTNARNYAYQIITFLNCCYAEDSLYKTFSLAVYSNLGNFPAMSYVERNSSAVDGRPWTRILSTKAKQIHQKIPYIQNNYFTDSQFALFEKLKTSDVLSFSGPTSMGKSFIVKAFIRYLIHTNSKAENIIILVPTRALISQYIVEIKEEFEFILEEFRYKILTTSNVDIFKSDQDSNFILILTPERLISLVTQSETLKVDRLFVDEAQKMANHDDSRSITTYLSIEKTIKKFPKVKIYFASPNVDNPNVFPKLFGKDGEGSSFATKEASVTQNLFFVNFLTKEVSYVFENQLHSLTIDKDFFSRITSIDKFFLMFSHNSNLVYCNSVSKTIHHAIQLAEQMNPLDHQELRDAAKAIRNYIHSDYYLAELVEKGIAYHYGNMPQLIRDLVEDLYSRGLIKFLFCTSTLLEGLNMPTQNLFILENKKSRKVMSSIDFWNLVGRAGRLAKELQGNVFCIQDGEHSWKNLDYLTAKDFQLLPTVSFKLENNLANIEKKTAW